MPTLKIYPPARLPSSGVTETQFNMWIEELEVYISQEPDFKMFLPEKLYGSWFSHEVDPNRIPVLKHRDTLPAGATDSDGRNLTQEEIVEVNDDRLDSIRSNLITVLCIIGKCVSEGHYNAVI